MCGTSACSSPVAAPANGATIPASTPALAIEQATLPAAPTLVDSAGNAVAATVSADPATGGQLLVPAAPLTAGATYHLRYDSAPCDGGAPASMDNGFTVGPAAQAPTSAGALSLYAQGVAPMDGVQSGYVQVQLQVSDDLLPFLATTRFVVTVDGKPWATAPYGVGGPSDVISVQAPCDAPADASSCGATTSLGDHVFTVQAHVAGMTSDPPALSANIRLACASASSGCALAHVGSEPRTMVATAGAFAIILMGGRLAARRLRRRARRRA